MGTVAVEPGNHIGCYDKIQFLMILRWKKFISARDELHHSKDMVTMAMSDENNSCFQYILIESATEMIAKLNEWALPAI